VLVWEAEQVVVFKRSMAAGYAGVQTHCSSGRTATCSSAMRSHAWRTSSRHSDPQFQVRARHEPAAPSHHAVTSGQGVADSVVERGWRLDRLPAVWRGGNVLVPGGD
jgi:hypothetical protein